MWSRHIDLEFGLLISDFGKVNKGAQRSSQINIDMMKTFLFPANQNTRLDSKFELLMGDLCRMHLHCSSTKNVLKLRRNLSRKTT